MDFNTASEKLEQNGYALIENFLTNEEVEALKERMQEILDGLDPSEHQTVFSTTNQTRNDYFLNSGDRIAFFFEEGALDKDGNLTVEKHLSVNKIGHALHCQDPVFSRVTQSEKVKEMVKSVMKFSDPVICQSMYIFKQPNIGGVDGVRNNHYMIRNPDDDPEKPALIFTNESAQYEDSEFVPVEMKAGSLLLINGEVVHKSEPNTSTRSRHAYTFHVFESEGVEYSKQNWLQPTSKNTFTHLLA